MQIVVDAQAARVGRCGHRLQTGLEAFVQRCEKRRAASGQRQPAIVPARLRGPALLGDEELFATAKSQAVVDPHRAVSQRPAQGEQRAHFERPERPLAIESGDRIAPHRSERRVDAIGQNAGAACIQIAQRPDRFGDGVLASRLPGLVDERAQQAAHRTDGFDHPIARDS